MIKSNIFIAVRYSISDCANDAACWAFPHNNDGIKVLMLLSLNPLWDIIIDSYNSTYSLTSF